MESLSRSFRRAAIGILALTLASSLLAQSGSELDAQGLKAYNAKEYAKSADLFLKAYQKDHKLIGSLYNGACSFALVGQTDQAFSALSELADHGYNTPDFLKADKDFTSIRSDARWLQIVAKIEENARKNPPPKRFVKPFKILPGATSAGTFADRLNGQDSALWVEGDVISFLHKTPAKEVRLSGGIQEPLSQIPGTDLWIIQLQMPKWDTAIISYNFIDDGKWGTVHFWNGANSVPQPAHAETLQGRLIERTLHSTSLGEDRKVSIYLPPNRPTGPLPAVFMADGQSCKSFAEVLEPLILAHRVRPCAIVGVFSGQNLNTGGDYDPTKDMRAAEYLPNFVPDRFDKHLEFFTHEVGAYVAKEFGISTKREDLAVTGFSNGGAFAAASVIRNPDFFGTSMPLSLGIPPVDPKPRHAMPRMFFAGGSLETFGASTEAVYKKMLTWGVETTFDLYVAGHDQAMWQLAFATLMPKVFPLTVNR